jgi:hypothetical protein
MMHQLVGEAQPELGHLHARAVPWRPRVSREYSAFCLNAILRTFSKG